MILFKFCLQTNTLFSLFAFLGFILTSSGQLNPSWKVKFKTENRFDKVKRVWKGIFGIRDLTEIRCGNRENDEYIDGIRDLTVPGEPGLAKNWARDAGFMFVCLSGMAETVTTHPF